MAVFDPQLLAAGGERLLLKRYRLTRVIGRGGMSVVYAARDERTGRPVAIKLLAHHLSDDELSRRRLLAEARAMSRLRHPHIVSLLDYGQSDGASGSVALVMELVEGETLHARLGRGPLPVAEAVRLAGQIGEALAYAHAQGVIHRDVKPHNVLLAADPGGARSAGAAPPQVKLADFGIARSLDASTSYTVAGHVVGSAPYLAPELLRGHAADGRADVYALGVTLFQMLTGRLPFSGETPAAILTQRLMREAPDVRQLRPVPAALAGVVARALAKEPDARYQTAGEFLAALRAAGSPRRTAPAATATAVTATAVTATAVTATAATRPLDWTWISAAASPDERTVEMALPARVRSVPGGAETRHVPFAPAFAKRSRPFGRAPAPAPAWQGGGVRAAGTRGAFAAVAAVVAASMLLALFIGARSLATSRAVVLSPEAPVAAVPAATGTALPGGIAAPAAPTAAPPATATKEPTATAAPTVTAAPVPSVAAPANRAPAPAPRAPRGKGKKED